LPLIYIQERARGPELIGRDHEIAASGEIGTEYVYTILITISTISLDAKYINTSFGMGEGYRPCGTDANAHPVPARCGDEAL
jgi:hypothetical protein